MKGLTLWKFQRVSALYLMIYFSYVGTMIYVHQSIMNYDLWTSFMLSMHMTVATFLALGFLAIHAWIGTRSIMTDYVKCLWMRNMFLGVYTLILAATTINGVLVYWS